MDLKLIYNSISDKLFNDFKISSQIPHGTDKGTYRENSLRDFLKDGRLPKKYSLGHGQIISRKNEISKSIDIVIYDNHDSTPLVYDESTQIFPIESVYGTIECKSKLTKDKLIEGLENIKSVKSLVPSDTAFKKTGFITTTYKRSIPFGIIFAYSLGNNSIDSIEKNISEWEKNNDPKYWPNLVVILNEALIFHRTVPELNIVVNSSDITENVILGGNRHVDEVFFKFYIHLMDMCSSIQLGGFYLDDYFNLPERINDLYVKGHDHFVDSKTKKPSKLKYDFLKEIDQYCDATCLSNYVEIYKKGIGGFIAGFDEQKYSNIPAYLYNPKNYPGMHEVEKPIEMINGRAEITKQVCFPCIEISLNDKIIFIPYSYLNENVFEIIV